MVCDCIQKMQVGVVEIGLERQVEKIIGSLEWAANCRDALVSLERLMLEYRVPDEVSSCRGMNSADDDCGRLVQAANVEARAMHSREREKRFMNNFSADDGVAMCI